MNLRAITLTILIALTVIVSKDSLAFEQMMTDDGLPVSFIGTNCFYYSLYEAGSDDFEFGELQEITRWSFDVWDDVECSYFDFFETDPSEVADVGFDLDHKNTNLIIWLEDPGSWGWGSSEIGMTTVNYDANTGRILDADIEFNGEMFVFANQDDYSEINGLIDLKNTLVHEIGHTIGLSHNKDDPQTTMFPTGEAGDTNKRTLDDDDIDGLCYIYPLDENPEQCAEPYCGLGISSDDLACDIEDESRCGCVAPGQIHTKSSLRKIILSLIFSL